MIIVSTILGFLPEVVECHEYIHQQITQLEKLLSILESSKAINCDAFDGESEISLANMNAKNKQVVECLLRYHGELPADNHLTKDPRQRTATINSAIKSFQFRHGLEADGIIGSMTRQFFMQDWQVRHSVLIDAIVSWYELLEKVPEGKPFVVVNIAQYQLLGFSKSKPDIAMPIIVGRPDRQTPLLQSRIEYITFNPIWYVPNTIFSKDKLSKLRMEIDHFTQLGYRVIDQSGAMRSVKEVNWWNVPANNQAYRLVQLPGDKNALGRIQFFFPNDHQVYLHATPDNELFNKHYRALSSGCVRLKEPFKFAKWLLQHSGFTQNNVIEQRLKSDSTSYQRLSQPITIFIVYIPMWIDETGVWHWHDPYRRTIS